MVSSATSVINEVWKRLTSARKGKSRSNKGCCGSGITKGEGKVETEGSPVPTVVGGRSPLTGFYL
jgi:hypothetical protein